MMKCNGNYSESNDILTWNYLCRAYEGKTVWISRTNKKLHLQTLLLKIWPWVNCLYSTSSEMIVNTAPGSSGLNVLASFFKKEINFSKGQWCISMVAHLIYLRNWICYAINFHMIHEAYANQSGENVWKHVYRILKILFRELVWLDDL